MYFRGKRLQERYLNMKITGSHLISFALGALVVAAGLGIGSLAWSEEKKQSEFDDGQVEAIEQVIYDYLMKRPEVIIEAVETLQAREKAAERERVAKAVVEYNELIYTALPGTVFGNPDGDVTVVEFFDYHCGYCKKNFDSLMSAVSTDKNLRLILKEFPVLGENSVVASKAALASQRQGKYVEFHQALMSASGKLTSDRIDAIAKSVGLDVAQMHRDMDDPVIAALIDHNRDLAHELGINGTPSFVINDKLFYGYLDPETLDKAIGLARADISDAQSG